jgi:hypothetical protein
MQSANREELHLLSTNFYSRPWSMRVQIFRDPDSKFQISRSRIGVCLGMRNLESGIGYVLFTP